MEQYNVEEYWSMDSHDTEVQEAHTDVIMLANSVRELVHKQRQKEEHGHLLVRGL